MKGLVVPVVLAILAGGCAAPPEEIPIAAQLTASAQKGFDEYLDLERFPDFKAFAIDTGSDYWYRSWSYTEPESAVARAMGDCERRAGACRLYAVGATVVLGFDEARLAEAMSAYYRGSVQFADPDDIRRRALDDARIRSYLAGRRGRGRSVTRGLDYEIEYFDSGRLVARVVDSKLSGRHVDEGEWWTENGHFCRRFQNWGKGRKVCALLVEEPGGFAVYSDDGGFRDRVRFVE